MHDGVRYDAELPIAVTAAPDTALALRTRTGGATDPVLRLHEVHVCALAVGALGRSIPAKSFKVGVGVSLGNYVLAECRYGRSFCHVPTFAQGCDTPSAQVGTGLGSPEWAGATGTARGWWLF